jgi:hypothetical protein
LGEEVYGTRMHQLLINYSTYCDWEATRRRVRISEITN